jgi:hypothetical protein
MILIKLNGSIPDEIGLSFIDRNRDTWLPSYPGTDCDIEIRPYRGMSVRSLDYVCRVLELSGREFKVEYK